MNSGIISSNVKNPNSFSINTVLFKFLLSSKRSMYFFKSPREVNLFTQILVCLIVSANFFNFSSFGSDLCLDKIGSNIFSSRNETASCKLLKWTPLAILLNCSVKLHLKTQILSYLVALVSENAFGG